MSAVSGNRRLGQSGEDQAAEWYLRNGYQILHRNWRFGRLGEIDIVAFAPGILVISEVKTRSSDRYGLPTEAITGPKQMRMRQLASSYAREYGSLKYRSIRFDVVSIIGTKLEVIENAF